VCQTKLTKLGTQAKGVLENIVVVVSLVHTLTESFGSASDLYHKLKRKTRSKSSDDEDETRRAPRRRLSHRRRDSSSDSDRGRRHHHLRRRSNARKDDFSDSDEELIVTSSSQVRAEYERGYKKLGEPFARGDCMQIIDSLIAGDLANLCSGGSNTTSGSDY
jgi:hypothetical protein